LVVLPLSFVCLENRVCFSYGVQVAGVAWHAATRIVTGVGDLVQMIRDGSTSRVHSGRAIKRSGGTMCDLYHTRGDEEREFLG
jgi:hypothetical protein